MSIRFSMYGVGLAKVIKALCACINPEPDIWSSPGVSMSRAEFFKRVRMASGLNVLSKSNFALASIISAATPAAWGEAAEVPKKLGNKVSGSMGSIQSPFPRSTVVFTPLGALMSGLSLTIPFTGVPPTEEKDMMTGTG